MKSKKISSVLTASVISMVGLANSALAVTCTESDWVKQLCELKQVQGDRCSSVDFFAMYCTNATVGCEAIPGGCYGTTAPGHWYPLVDAASGKPTSRCRCGCFAEDTTFNRETIMGSDLIKNKESGLDGEGIRIASLDDIDSADVSDREISDITFSEGFEEAYEFKTASGKRIALSGSHPVVIGGEQGKLSQIKRAELVKAGEFFVDDQNQLDKVVSVSRTPTGSRVFNFNVKSTNPAHHVVLANGLKMGDVALQTRLNSFESRLMFRADVLKDIETSQKK